MNKRKNILFGLLLLNLSGCNSLPGFQQSSISKPSVSYSSSILTTTDTPDIEPNTPVAKAIEFMESSNPELITENSVDNKPRMVSSQIYTHKLQKKNTDETDKKNKDKHKISSKDFFFPGHLEIKKPQPEPVVRENLRNIPLHDSHSAFIFSD